MTLLAVALSLLVGQTNADAAAPATPDAGAPPPVAAAPDLTSAAADAAQAAKLAAEAAAKAADAVAAMTGHPLEMTPTMAPPAPVVPPAPPAAAAAAVDQPSTSANVGINLIWLQGNSNTLTLSGTAGATHTFSGGWILSGKAAGAYGDSEAAGTTTSQVTAYNLSGQARLDKVIIPETAVFVQGGASTDHVASLELRYFGEAGAAIFWFDRKEGDFQKLLLRTDIAFRFQEDDNWQYYPTATGLPIAGTGPLGNLTFVGPRFGVAFRYALNKGVIFTEDASLMENIDGDSRTLASSQTKLTAALTAHLAFATGFLVTYDSNLTNLGKVDTDTALTVGLEGSF